MTKSPLKAIEEFNLNERVYGNYLIKEAKEAVNRKGKPYLDVTLVDKTGEILAKIWDSDEFQAATLVANTLVYATGVITEFNGELQLKVEHIEVNNNKTLDIVDFVPSAPFPVDDMMQEIDGFINAIKDDEIRTLTKEIVAGDIDNFKTHPAARGMHHAVYGGLAYHVLTMLKSAEGLLRVYPFINADLIYASIILHDFEKVTEMEAVNGMANGYSRRGSLLGHIVQGILLVEEYGEKLDISKHKIETLQHLIASHHGKGEWGSPQPAKTPEAVLLHFIDNIDAKMYMVNEAMQGSVSEQGETSRVKGLGNQSLFLYEY